MTPRRGYLPLADIAAIYRISRRTAARWAKQDHWRRRDTPPQYSVTDADRSRRARRTDTGQQKRGPYKRRGSPP